MSAGTTTGKVLRGGAVLGVGQVSSYGLTFVRNVIVARLVGPEHFGLAAMFTLTLTFLEMISNLGIDRFLVQRPDGDDERLQATVHATTATRALFLAMAVYVLAGPAANLLHYPDATWAFRCLAVLPLLRGLVHTDYVRLQRSMNFRAVTAIDVLTQAVPTLVAWPLAAWLRDYSAILWLLILQALTTCVASHLLAVRPYKFAWDKRHLRALFSFGWPLLLDGLLLFAVFQGDRLIIGTTYPLADLGVYSVAFGIAFVPTVMFSRVGGWALMPVLSKCVGDRGRFERHFLFVMQCYSLASLVIAIPFIVAGGPLIVLLYGRAYATAATVIGWLAAMQAFQLLTSGTTLACLSRGDTRTSLLSSLVRASAVLGALAVAATGGPLIHIAICGCLGEGLRLGATTLSLRLRHGINETHVLLPAGLAVIGMLLAASVSAGPAANVTGAILVSVIIDGLVGGAALMLYPGFASRCWELFGRRGVRPATIEA